MLLTTPTRNQNISPLSVVLLITIRNHHHGVASHKCQVDLPESTIDKDAIDNSRYDKEKV
jgi:hypothetical protein